MEIVLAALTFEICLCYLDDVICFGRTLVEHSDRLRAVLLRFREHNLRVKLEKCRFAETKVAFLGHVVSREGISPDPRKRLRRFKTSQHQHVYKNCGVS
jgi:peroxiredoxin